MKEIKIYEKAVAAPETPEELTDWHYEALLRLKYYRDCGRSGMEWPEALKDVAEGPERMVIMVAMILCGYMPGQLRLLNGTAMADLRSEAVPLARRFFDARGEISIGQTTNRIPTWWGREARYKGPGDMLDGMSYGDVIRALQMLTAGGLTVGSLMEVASIMYGLPESELQEPTKALYTLAAHCAEMLLYVWGLISTTPIRIGGEMLDLSILFKTIGPVGADDGLGWNGITFEVARSGVFGTVPEVERAGFWEVLLYLYKCRFEYNEERKNSKKS